MKFNTNLFFYFIITLSVTFANTTILSAQSENSLHLGLSFTPKLSNQLIEDADLGDVENAFSFSANLDFYLDLSSRLQLKAGGGYAQFKTKNLDYSPLFACDFDGNGNPNNQNSYYKSSNTISFIVVPVALKIKVVGEENHLFLEGGIQNYFLLNSSEDLELYECNGANIVEVNNLEIFDPQSFFFTLTAGIGYEAALGDQLKLILQPLMEIALTKTFKEEGVSTDLFNNSRLLNFGFLAGLKF